MRLAIVLHLEVVRIDDVVLLLGMDLLDHGLHSTCAQGLIWVIPCTFIGVSGTVNGFFVGFLSSQNRLELLLGLVFSVTEVLFLHFRDRGLGQRIGLEEGLALVIHVRSSDRGT